MSEPTPSPASKSRFVTALAWISFVLAGLITCLLLLQNLLVNFLWPIADLQRATARLRDLPSTLPIAAFLLDNIRLFFLTLLLVSATTFASAVGLLRRQNWARVFFVILLTLGMIWNIGGIYLSFEFLWNTQPFTVTIPKQYAEMFDVVARVMICANIVIAVLLTAVFGWVIRRLQSQQIRLEF